MPNPIYLDPTYCASDNEIDGLIIELHAEIRAARASIQAITDSFNGLLRLILRREVEARSHPHTRNQSTRDRRPVPIEARQAAYALQRARFPDVPTRAPPFPLGVLTPPAPNTTPSSVPSSSSNTLNQQQPIRRARGGRHLGYSPHTIIVPSSDSEEFEDEFLNYTTGHSQ
ncbi:hypothetical protein BDN72DRAFT_904705 [Pluteus cervinus]|uniref:Uncharacterized protein n=1 Tax=Pluteus cervinus TaxID=181527 RepID=A0ACD3A7E2_9AGAR|nr:hypothetical protein BDN72DRAFT_904705 [Pluteus cervinus]